MQELWETISVLGIRFTCLIMPIQSPASWVLGIVAKEQRLVVENFAKWKGIGWEIHADET